MALDGFQAVKELPKSSVHRGAGFRIEGPVDLANDRVLVRRVNKQAHLLLSGCDPIGTARDRDNNLIILFSAEAIADERMYERTRENLLALTKSPSLPTVDEILRAVDAGGE